MPTSKQPKLLRGSLITLKRKCGKKTCRCQEGALHETPALSCLMDGKHHVITIAADDLTQVQQAVDGYTAARERLEHACRRGISWLRTRVERRKRVRQQHREGRDA